MKEKPKSKERKLMKMNIEERKISAEKISNLLKKSKSDDGTFLDSLYNLYILIGINKGMKDIKEGKCMTLEESKERMKQKYANYSNRYGS